MEDHARSFVFRHSESALAVGISAWLDFLHSPRPVKVISHPSNAATDKGLNADQLPVEDRMDSNQWQK